MGPRIPRRCWVFSSVLAVIGVSSPAAAAPHETEVLTGAFVSPLWNRGRRRTFDCAALLVRESWPLTFAGHSYPGWDWVGDFFAAEVTSGFGHVLVGPSLPARRWWGPAGAAWRPYVQIGFGAPYSDAYRDPDQQQLGEALQFKTTASFGFQALLAHSWSWAGELSFNHFPDGGLSGRNYGIHALGLTFGLARSF